MTPLQKVAMGLVIVLVDAGFSGWDAVPDPLGWLLVVLGLLGLRESIDASALLTLAALAGAISLAVAYPAVHEDLADSTGWLLSLPQLAFAFLLCIEVGRLVAGLRPDLARRLLGLRWVFLLVAVGPVLLYGGGVALLLVPLALVAVAAGVYQIYLIFRCAAALADPSAPPEAAGDPAPRAP